MLILCLCVQLAAVAALVGTTAALPHAVEPAHDADACTAAAASACGGAKKASAGNCLVCTLRWSAHQARLQAAGCTDADLDAFCTARAPAGGPPAPPLLNPAVVVAVGPGANEQESWAAYMLAAGLGLAMGGPAHPYDFCSHPFAGGSTGKCGVVTPAEVGNRSAIFVGTRAAAAAGLNASGAANSVGGDGFLCSTSWEDPSTQAEELYATPISGTFRVALTGGLGRDGAPTPRGTINAVQTFLHRLGLRWWTPYKDVDPTWTGPGIARGLSFGMRLAIPGCHKIGDTPMESVGHVFKPRFEYRSILSKGILSSTQSAIWNVQNHLNGGADRTGNCKSLVIPKSMGGMMMFTNGTCASSVYTLLPPASCTPPPWPGHPPGSKPGFCHEPEVCVCKIPGLWTRLKLRASNTIQLLAGATFTNTRSTTLCCRRTLH
jgi:hypothetical protein